MQDTGLVGLSVRVTLIVYGKQLYHHNYNIATQENVLDMNANQK